MVPYYINNTFLVKYVQSSNLKSWKYTFFQIL